MVSRGWTVGFRMIVQCRAHLPRFRPAPLIRFRLCYCYSAFLILPVLLLTIIVHAMSNYFTFACLMIALLLCAHQANTLNACLLMLLLVQPCRLAINTPLC